MNLNEIREKYPQYNDVSDNDLEMALTVKVITAFHQKYYSDVPFDTFAETIGLKAKESQSTDYGMNQLGPSTEPLPKVGGFMGEVVEPTVQTAAKIIPALATAPAAAAGSGIAGVGAMLSSSQTMLQMQEDVGQGYPRDELTPGYDTRQDDRLATAGNAVKKAGKIHAKMFGLDRPVSPEEAQGIENIFKPFEMFRTGTWKAGVGLAQVMADEGAAELADQFLGGEFKSERIKTREMPYLAPIIATLGEAGVYLLGPKLTRSVAKTTWYRRMSVRERGLVVQALPKVVDNLREMGYSDAQIARKLPEVYEQMLQEQMTPEGARTAEAAPKQPAKERPAVAPKPAEPTARGKSFRLTEPQNFELRPRPDEVQAIFKGMLSGKPALPPGQGFEIVGSKPRGFDLVPIGKAVGPQMPIEKGQYLEAPEERLALPPGQGFTLKDAADIDTCFDALRESVGKAEFTRKQKRELRKKIEAERDATIERFKTEQQEESLGSLPYAEVEKKAPVEKAETETIKGVDLIDGKRHKDLLGSADPVMDSEGVPTGWAIKKSDTEITLVNQAERQAKTFPLLKGSGPDELRKEADATEWAIENRHETPMAEVVKSEKAAPEPSGEAMREPWEMTPDEYVGDTTGDAKAVKLSAHPQHVKRAIEQGKDVPLAVLEKYDKNVWAQKAIKNKEIKQRPPWEMTKEEYKQRIPKMGLSEKMSPADAEKYKLASIIDGILYEAQPGEVIHTNIDKRVIGDVGKHPELYDQHDVIGGFIAPDGEFIPQSPVQYHRFQVEKAHSEGKAVPPEVLKDYPDLAKKGRDLFTPEQLKDFDRLDIDVSGVTEQYKTEALQQIDLKTKHEGKTPEEYNEWVRKEDKAADERRTPPKPARVPRRERNKGPRNLITYLQKQGFVRLGEYSDKTGDAWSRSRGRRSKDRTRELGDIAAVTRQKGKMAMDEAAANLNAEGWIHPGAGEWTADNLYQVIASGQGRKVFTPDKWDDMFEQSIRKEQNEWIEQQLANLGEEIPDVESRLIEDVGKAISQKWDVSEEEKERALAELGEFFETATPKKSVEPIPSGLRAGYDRMPFDQMNLEGEAEPILVPKEESPKPPAQTELVTNLLGQEVTGMDKSATMPPVKTGKGTGNIPPTVPESPKGEARLIEEAKKYKTAEEFVEAKENEYVYHTTTPKNIQGIINEGLTKDKAGIYPHGEELEDSIGEMIYFTESEKSNKEAGTFAFGADLRVKKIALDVKQMVDRKMYKRIETRYWGNNISPADIEIKTDEGYIPLLEYAEQEGMLEELKKQNFSWNESDLTQERQQLTDIWNKENKPVEKGIEKGKESAIIESVTPKKGTGDITPKESLDRRRASVRTIRDYFTLTDTELKQITKRDIRLMSDPEFKKFKDDMEVKAGEIAEKRQTRNELDAVRKAKAFKAEENIRKFHKLPPISKMSRQQLKEYTSILEQYEPGDQFLSPKRIGRLENTKWNGSKTIREVLEKASKEFDVPVSELKGIRVKELDRFRYDTALARQNPFYNFMVDEIQTAEIRTGMKYFEVREQMYALAKKALKSRKRGIGERIVPRQKTIMEYLEAEESAKTEKADALTKEELDLALFIQDFYAKAYNHLLINQDLQHSRFADSQYMFHAKRPLSELLIDIKDTGIKRAVSDLLNRWRLDETNFTVLDSKTGEVLAMKKFFRQTLYRTGELTPTKNVIKATDIYMQQFFKKMALDESVPTVETLAMAIRPQEKTQNGLFLNDSLMTFVKQYLNNKKGRTINIGIQQGGKIDAVIRAVNNLISLKYIALNIPLEIAAIVGETTAKIPALGINKLALANARKFTPQGRRILRKYKGFTGEGVIEEMMQPGRNIGENANMFLYGVFSWMRKTTKQDILLSNMTKAEFRAGEISPEKLAEVTKMMGRWIDLGSTKSVLGSTSTGAALTKFKGWAIPIVSSTVQDAASLARTLTRLGNPKKRLNKQQAWELLRIAEIGAIVVAVSAVTDQGSRDTFSGKLKYYAMRELTTLFQALSVRTMLTLGVTVAFLEKFSSNLQLLVNLEGYKTKSGYKGVEGLKKQFTPAAVTQFQKKPGKATLTKKQTIKGYLKLK